MPNDFKIRLDPNIARVVEYEDSAGLIQFTVDLGSKGNKSLCLEHHPKDWPRDKRYHLAFRRTKRYLESKGFEVEIYGE